MRAAWIHGSGGSVTIEDVGPPEVGPDDVLVMVHRCANYDEFVETARAFETGLLHADQMVSDVIALEELPVTLDQLRAGSARRLKIHVDPQRGLNREK